MKKTINLLLICIIFSCFVSYPAWSLAQETGSSHYTGIISADSVNIRSGPGGNFEILRKMNKESLILVVDSVNTQWLKIKLPRNSKAFVHKDLLSIENSLYGIITHKRVNVRAGEGTHFNVIGQLNPKERVEIIRKDNEWYQIYPYDNCFAWVHKDFVRKSGPAKLYTDFEAKNIDGLKLLIEAENFEKKNKSKALNIKDLSPIIQKYKVIIRDYEQSPATEKARLHIDQLMKLAAQIKKPQIQAKQKPKQNLKQTAEKSNKVTLLQPNSKPDAQGKIIEVGRYFKRPGTHRLTKDGKTLYFLSSKKVNINEYIYHHVQIWGKITNSKTSKIPVIEVNFIKKLN